MKRRCQYSMLLVVFFICGLCFGEQEQSIDYGRSMFKYLKKRYPQHFVLISKTGERVTITEDDLIGRYVTSVFSKKTSAGWLHCAGRQPIGAFENSNSQCVFYQLMEQGRDGVEILISSRFDAKNSSPEKFWACLVFEVANAAQGKEFVAVIESHSQKTITPEECAVTMMRMEYNSALDAQKIQDQVWRRFCKDKNIDCMKKNWFIPNDTNFVQWCNKLKNTKAGRNYIEAYNRATMP